MIAGLSVNHKDIMHYLDPYKHTCPLHVISADEMCALLLQSCKQKKRTLTRLEKTPIPTCRSEQQFSNFACPRASLSLLFLTFSWQMTNTVMEFGYLISISLFFLTILFWHRFLLSFGFDWEDEHLEVAQKLFHHISYFQLSSQCLQMHQTWSFVFKIFIITV